MSSYRVLSYAAQQTQYRDYKLQAHTKSAFTKETLRFLRQLHFKARSEKGIWAELSNYRKGHRTGVTGQNITYAFRLFVGGLQGNRCCYCRRWLQNIAHAKPVEHILPSSLYPQFSVYFWNLAVSCFDCNQLKGKANWGSFPIPRLHYPKPEAFTEFYHPRFHHYTDHISYTRTEHNDVRSVTYSGHTEQGRHLCNELLYIIAARENLYSTHPTLAEATATLQQYHDRHAPGELPALEKFRDSLHRTMQYQLDHSSVDGAPLKGN